jgi:hypothetical protein
MDIEAFIDKQNAELQRIALDSHGRNEHGARYCGALLGTFWFAAMAIGSVMGFPPEDTGIPVAAGQRLAQDDPVSAQVRTDWQTLVGDLQAPEFARRESASKLLGSTDFAAMVQVLPLLTSDDAELAWRAKEVMIQQGIRGSGDVVRRIGLVLRLLTAAGHPQFAEDAEKFESRIAAMRVLEATRRLEAIPEISVIPGPQFRGMMVGGNVLRIQRGIVVGQAQIVEIGPRFVVPNAAPIELLEVPNLPPNREIDRAAPVLPEQAVPVENVADPLKSAETEIAADEQIRQAHLNANLKNWLEQCITSDPESLATLEQTWQGMGLIGATSAGLEQQVAQYFEIAISRTIGDEPVAALRNLFHNPVSVILTMNDVNMSPGLQKLVVESVEAGKIQYLNTYKCGYSMETSDALSKLMKEGRLGQWQTQGRAMLGIRTDNLLLGRSDTAERGGALVGTVTEDSAAAIAGIQPGDLIRKINDIPVENFEELRRIVAVFDVGDTLKIDLARNNSQLELNVTLMEHSQ